VPQLAIRYQHSHEAGRVVSIASKVHELASGPAEHQLATAPLAVGRGVIDQDVKRDLEVSVGRLRRQSDDQLQPVVKSVGVAVAAA
jgi:hypothetical protein